MYPRGSRTKKLFVNPLVSLPFILIVKYAAEVSHNSTEIFMNCIPLFMLKV
jgi:hypothetical protein